MEPANDLGLALDYKEQIIETTSNNNSGEGVNAATGLRMKFVASDSLSELVWSPINGLSFECAKTRLADNNKPLLLWNVMLSNTFGSPLQCTTDARPIDELNLITSRAVIREDSEGVMPVLRLRHERDTGSSGSKNKINRVESVLHINREGGNKRENEEEMSLPPSRNLQVATIAETKDLHTGHENHRTINFLLLENNVPGPEVALSPFDKAMMANNLGGRIGDIPRSNQTLEPNIDVATEVPIVNECEGVAKNKKKMHLSTSPSPQEEKIESSAENDLQLVLIDEHVPLEASQMKSGVKMSRGKVKDDSHKTLESCNSSSGKRQRSFEQPTGSKRVKIHIHEEMASTSLIQHESSFANWISNMVKGGIMKHDHNEAPCLDLSLTPPNLGHEIRAKEITTRKQTTGFQNIFQSLYCSNTTAKGIRISDDCDPKEGSQVLEVAPKAGNTADGVEVIHNLNCENDLLESTWITRFTPKTCGPAVNVDQVSSVAKEIHILSKEPRIDAPGINAFSGLKRFFGQNEPKPISQLSPNLNLIETKSSVAMASMLARRLDALKHFPSGLKEDSTPASTCSFCGRNGHDIRQCSLINETELEDLLRNINSYEGSEGSAILCIKCFHLDHWAISCPIRRHKQSEDVPSLADHCSTRKTLLISENESRTGTLEKEESRHQGAEKDSNFSRKKPRIIDNHLNLKLSGLVSFAEKHSVSKFIASCSEENELIKENQIKQISDVPRGMFEAVQRLRLSRMDVLKSMKSRNSLPLLHGFFLRLRLGNCDKGLVGTGYSVAQIIGVHTENSANVSKSPILVNVGGLKCFVGTQYISNHEFAEYELVAWWSATSRSGGKLPSEDDMKSKFDERKMLGI